MAHKKSRGSPPSEPLAHFKEWHEAVDAQETNKYAQLLLVLSIRDIQGGEAPQSTRVMEKRQLEGQVEELAPKTKKQLLAEERERARLEREAEKEARRRALEHQKQEREAARLLEKQQRDREKQRAAEERERAKQAKIKEREALKEAKEREKEAAREAKEREKEALREAKEREKEAAREAKEKAKLAQQPRLGNFFAIVKKDGEQHPQEKSTNDFDSTFLEYRVKPHSQFYSTGTQIQSPKDCIAWLKSQPSHSPTSSFMTTSEFRAGLELGRDPEKLLERLRLRYIQLVETVRPAFVGTVPDITSEALIKLCLEPTSTVLPLEYSYDSDLEWAPGEEDDEDLMGDDQSDEDNENASDMDSFLASDDEDMEPRRRHRAIRAAEPVIRWNDGHDPEFRQFAIQLLEKAPLQIGAYTVSCTPSTASSAQVDLPLEAVVAILKRVQGHTGTKALLIETLYHDLHKEFASLTRTGLKSVIDTHAKRDKTGWTILPEKASLLEFG